MTHTTLLLVNVTAFGFAALYLWQALRVGRLAATIFVCTIFYALGVEMTEVVTNHPYYYKDLLLMIGSSPAWVPLGVCLFWACYLFACMQLTGLLGLKWFERAPVDALLAVSIDFIGDPAVSASRSVGQLGQWCNDLDTPTFGGLGAWIWCVPAESATWFNVPFENYFAWFLVVCVVSFALRFLQEKLPVTTWGLSRQVLTVATVMLASAVAVLLGVDAFSYLGQFGVWVQWALLGGAFALPVAILVNARHRLNIHNEIDWPLVALPAASVVTCFGIFVWFKVDHAHWPWAVIQLGIASLLSLALIFLAFVGRILRRR